MKHLGQHFLKNKTVAKKIVAALELASGDTVLEIGPGHGELTEELGVRCKVLGIGIIAIEKDGGLVELLRKKFASNKNVEVVEGDALKIIPELTKSYNLKPKTYKLLGNIPYYITGHLLRTLGELTPQPSVSVLMVQEEVAERIAATAPRMNRLAASVQCWATPKIILRVPRNEFAPPPKIDSAVIALKFKKQKLTAAETNAFYYAVGVLFQQPRKTILNNLMATKKAKREIFEEELIQMGIPPENRPQNLTIEDIVRVALFLASRKSSEK